MSQLVSVRPNLEVADLGPAVACLRDVLGFEVDVDEEEMGLVLLHRDAVGVAVVRSARPTANETTAGYIGVTGVDALHVEVAARGAKIVAGPTYQPRGRAGFVAVVPGGG